MQKENLFPLSLIKYNFIIKYFILNIKIVMKYQLNSNIIINSIQYVNSKQDVSIILYMLGEQKKNFIKIFSYLAIFFSVVLIIEIS